MPDVIGVVNHRRSAQRTALAIFDWTFTAGEGTAVADVSGRVLTINDGSISTLSTAAAWANAGYLTATQNSANKNAWADVWTPENNEFSGVRGDTLLWFVRGVWQVPASSSADWAVLATLNGSGVGNKGFALKIGGATGSRPGKGTMNYYYNDTVTGVGGLDSASVPVWVDGAEHSVAQLVDFSTGAWRTYMDGVMRVSGTTPAIARVEIRQAIGAAGGRLLFGAGAASTASAHGGGRFRRALALRRNSAPSAAAADALVARLHGMPAYPIHMIDWDDAA